MYRRFEFLGDIIVRGWRSRFNERDRKKSTSEKKRVEIDFVELFCNGTIRFFYGRVRVEHSSRLVDLFRVEVGGKN